MIKNFKVENFFSIGEAQEVSFEISPKDMLDPSARKIGESYINLVNCVIGHNASGKTNAMKAITFLYWFVSSAYTKFKDDKLIPFKPHALKKKHLSKISIEFVDKENCYLYEIHFNKKEVRYERLDTKLDAKGGRYSLVFEADRGESDKTLKPNGFTVNQADLERFMSRRNVPILSALLDTGYLPKITFFNNYESNVSQYGLIIRGVDPVQVAFRLSEHLHKNKKSFQMVLDILKEIDIGVSDFTFNEINLTEKESSDIKKVNLLEFVHKAKDDSFNIPLYQQSNGTQNAVSLLVEALQMLSSGGVFIADEIEAQLHPFVAKKIISLFEKVETNKNNAQIIFSTHQHLLLNERTKSQIFLAEKQAESLSTEIYRLDDVEGVRNDENFANKYLSGAYGAIAKNIWL